MKRLILCVIIVLAVLGLAACARSGDDTPWLTEDSGFDLPLTGGSTQRQRMSIQAGFAANETVADMAPMVEDQDQMYWSETEAGQVEWEDVAGQNRRHIIQTANTEMETENFDDVVAALRQLAPEADGYIESEMLTRWLFTIVLRVPAGSFETVLRHVQSLADVRFTNQWAEDVTDRFYDMIGSLETRRIEEERILALIDNADNVRDLLVLEQRLTNTRIIIETYLSQLNQMAGQIAYSTINVTVVNIAEEEVIIAVPTLGERIGGAFGDSVDGTVNVAQNIIVFLASVVIPFTLLGIIGFGIYFLITRPVLRRRAGVAR